MNHYVEYCAGGHRGCTRCVYYMGLSGNTRPGGVPSILVHCGYEGYQSSGSIFIRTTTNACRGWCARSCSVCTTWKRVHLSLGVTSRLASLHSVTLSHERCITYKSYGTVNVIWQKYCFMEWYALVTYGRAFHLWKLCCAYVMVLPVLEHITWWCVRSVLVL